MHARGAQPARAPLPNLSLCEREPIHIPGAVQPHGVLLVVDPDSGEVIGTAGPAAAMLGVATTPVGSPLEAVIGRSLETLVAGTDIAAASEPLYVGSLSASDSGADLDILAHRRGSRVLIEIEPALSDRPSASRLFARMREAASRIQTCSTADGAFAATADEIRAATGFDRVLIYRFLSDQSGEVVGEARAPAMDSYLGARFPASDIPPQARALYLRNPIRVIPDIRYAPSALEGVEPDLDMSDCSLRSVSPVHLRYLENMGVRASMSVSLLRDGALWGLIACHHATPHLVPYETREACKQVAAELSRHLRWLEEEANLDAQRRLTREIDELTGRIGGKGDVPAGLADALAEIAAAFDADGMVVRTPDLSAAAGPLAAGLDASALIGYLARRFGEGVHRVAEIESLDPANCWRQSLDCGLLFASTGGSDPVAFVLLRRRIPEIVRWAGDPVKSPDVDASTGALSPRRSFALWLQEHRGFARPWTGVEEEAAERLARQLERLVRQHRIATLQAELIHVSRVSAMGALASTLAHELNQPLTAMANFSRGIGNLLNARGEDGIEGALAYLDQMSQAAVRAGQVVKRLRSMVGKAPVQRVVVNLEQVVGDALSLALPDAHVRKIEVATAIAPDAARVLGDAVQIEQVLTNLIRNAAEAMEAVQVRRLSITARALASGPVEVRVADSGPGLTADTRDKLFAPFSSSKMDGMGLGLSICRTIVERHGGRIWAETGSACGTAFRFTLPRPPAPGDKPAG
jgi:two-component system, chemotaxis family, sensor kinase Cph1